MSYALQIRAGHTSPLPQLPPRPSSPDPNPSLRRGRGGGRAKLSGRTETREAKRPPHQARPGPLGSAALHCPPGPAEELMPKSRATRAQRSALTREGRWRRRSSTCVARRAEAGTRAPQRQPRQPPSCQHRSGRHRPPAAPGGGEGRGLLLKGPRRAAPSTLRDWDVAHRVEG